MLSVAQLLPFCIALAIAAAVPGPGVVALIAVSYTHLTLPTICSV